MVLAMSSHERNEGIPYFPVILHLTDPELRRRNLVMVRYHQGKTNVLQHLVSQHVMVADGVEPKTVGSTPEKLVNVNIHIIHQRSGDATRATTRYQDTKLGIMGYQVNADGRKLVLEEVKSG